jgi:hypothetical protein
MAKRIPILQLVILFLIVLAGLCKPVSDRSRISTAEYQITLPSADPIHDSNEAILLPASDKVLVQATHFNLAQEFLFVLGLAFSLLLTFKVAVCKAPFFTSSYFENTFCHHIAINAP